MQNTENSTYNQELINAIWNETIDLEHEEASPGRAYFERRGLSPRLIEDPIRFHRSLPYFDDSKQMGAFPAIVSRFAQDDTSLHLIYLDTQGQKATVTAVKKFRGSVSGAAIQFDQPNEELHLTEGVETGMAVREALMKPTWATGSATNLEKVVIPKAVLKVFIWADLDLSGTGQRVAMKLANRLRRDGKTVHVLLPTVSIPDEQKGVDWLDIFVSQGPKALQAAYENALPWVPTTIDNDSGCPPPPRKEAFFGVAGDFVRCIEPNSESDPFALLMQFLVAAGSVFDRRSYIQVEADKHYSNLFAVAVGKSSKGRKGTSWGHVRKIFASIAPDWTTNCIGTGLSSGEGLIARVRDTSEKKEEIRDRAGTVTGYQAVIKDHGVPDKRFLTYEPDFPSVLRAVEREGNKLSAIIRSAWDTGILDSLVKINPIRATNAHISIIGHSTRDELLRYLSGVEAANGFANRFLWYWVKRSKLLPFGGTTDSVALDDVRVRLSKAIQFASTIEELSFASDARCYWSSIYRSLSEERAGLLGAVTSRGEAQVLRISLIFALLDRSLKIEHCHLKAALAVWEYCELSCLYIFGESAGDKNADKLLGAVRQAPDGLTRTQIRNLFGKNRNSEEILKILNGLRDASLAECRQVVNPTTNRFCETWFFTEKTERPTTLTTLEPAIESS